MISRLRHAENLAAVVIFTIVYAIAIQLIVLAVNPLRAQILAQQEICHTSASAQAEDGEQERGPSCGLSCCLGLNRDDTGPALIIQPHVPSGLFAPALAFIRTEYRCKAGIHFSSVSAAGFQTRAPPAQA